MKYVALHTRLSTARMAPEFFVRGRPSDAVEMIRIATMYRDYFGHRTIPIVPGTKRAAIAWRPFQSRFATDGEIAAMFSRPCDIALCTGMGTVVVDVDDAALLEEILRCTGETPMKSRTPSGGFHLWFATPKDSTLGAQVRIGGRSVDLRGDRSYSIEPWSRGVNGVPYEWLGPVTPAHELPQLRTEWLRVSSPARIVQPLVHPSTDLAVMIRRATAYVATIEGAISGQRGHDRTFRVCSVLAHKFQLPEEHAWPILLRWNEQCEPPWSHAELDHKMRDAYRKAS